MQNLWNDKKYGALSPLDQLVARSRLIGSEPALCVWGGGNTSTKIEEQDLRGIRRRVVRVKGSGSDLKSCQPKDFTALDLDAVLPARERRAMTDHEMVRYLTSCQLDPQAPRASIEALLHAFVAHRDIDHTHADAILAVTNQRGGRRLAHKLFGERLIWVDYVKPGFLLAQRVAQAVEAHPKAEGVILEKHGLITWSPSSRESYSRTIEFVTIAENFFSSRRKKVPATFGSKSGRHFSSDEWRLRFYPVIRRVVGRSKPVILAHWDSPPVMAYVNHPRAAAMSQIGPATPDHMLRTKRAPLFVRCPAGDPSRLTEEILTRQLEVYAEAHRRYYERFKKPGMPMLHPYPRIILIPRVGMIAAGKDRPDADIAAEVYSHSMRIQLDASRVSRYESLSLAEQFEMEYWDLELYKLSLASPEKELARRVALVTGACGGIGRAICQSLIEAGAHVVATDLSASRTRELEKELCQTAPGRAIGMALDVRREASVRRAVTRAILHFGGLDIVVSNAGTAKISPIDRLDLADWQSSLDVNATGHFLVAREAIRHMQRQGTGGTIVFITTKNVLAPGKDFGAYSAAKAAQAQLARVIAIENGPVGIRVNMVNPDGVFEGSGLWNDQVRRERAQSYGIAPKALEDFYRQRNLLKTRVTPRDVAQAVLFLVGPRSAKTTGCIVTVDGGVKEAFPR